MAKDTVYSYLLEHKEKWVYIRSIAPELEISNRAVRGSLRRLHKDDLIEVKGRNAAGKEDKGKPLKYVRVKE